MRSAFRKLSELEPVDGDGAVNIVIETIRGARTKLAYSDDHSAFVVKKVLPQGMSFPFDFGFIPSTVGDDGDPLDVLVLIDESVPTGAIVPSRLIGVIQAKQTEKNGKVGDNDRLIAVALTSELFADVKKLSALPESVVRQIEQFFVNYNEQAGKIFEPEGRHGRKRAQLLLERGRKRRRKRDRR